MCWREKCDSKVFKKYCLRKMERKYWRDPGANTALCRSMRCADVDQNAAELRRIWQYSLLVIHGCLYTTLIFYGMLMYYVTTAFTPSPLFNFAIIFDILYNLNECTYIYIYIYVSAHMSAYVWVFAYICI